MAKPIMLTNSDDDNTKKVFHIKLPDNDKVIGRLALSLFPDSKKAMEIEQVYIAPAYRCKGYGTFTMKHVLGIADELGIDFVYALIDADNPDQLHFFQRFGQVNEMDKHGLRMVVLRRAAA